MRFARLSYVVSLSLIEVLHQNVPAKDDDEVQGIQHGPPTCFLHQLARTFAMFPLTLYLWSFSPL